MNTKYSKLPKLPCPCMEPAPGWCPLWWGWGGGEGYKMVTKWLNLLELSWISDRMVKYFVKSVQFHKDKNWKVYIQMCNVML